MPDPPPRKLLFVSEQVHRAITDMAAQLKVELGRRVTQSEIIERALEALNREREQR